MTLVATPTNPTMTRVLYFLLSNHVYPPGLYLPTANVGGKTRGIMESIDADEKPTANPCAVVTGANKGIGLAVTRQLAERGITVILTARNVALGTSAVRSLLSSGLSGVIFHQLDVRDPLSVASLASFLAERFGKLDILVNNAGVSGATVNVEEFLALNLDLDSWAFAASQRSPTNGEISVKSRLQISGKANNLVQGLMEQTYESAEICIDTNYFGCKRVTEALLPLLRLSPSGAKIVNVSSLSSELRRIPNERIRDELADVEKLDEERIEKVLGRFLEDFKEGRLEAGGWPVMMPAYSMSKVAMNAYTRVLARRYPQMRINCVHPGFVKTDINWNVGVETTDEGAVGPVMLALLPAGWPTGHYFDKTVRAEF